MEEYCAAIAAAEHRNGQLISTRKTRAMMSSKMVGEIKLIV